MRRTNRSQILFLVIILLIRRSFLVSHISYDLAYAFRFSSSTFDRGIGIFTLFATVYVFRLKWVVLCRGKCNVSVLLVFFCSSVNCIQECRKATNEQAPHLDHTFPHWSDVASTKTTSIIKKKKKSARHTHKHTNHLPNKMLVMKCSKKHCTAVAIKMMMTMTKKRTNKHGVDQVKRKTGERIK